MKNPLKGTIQISRPQCSDRDDDFMTIEVVDELSGTQFIEIEIDAKDLMLALTGRAGLHCVFELMASRVGYKSEGCEVIVEVPNITYDKNREAKGAEFLANHPLASQGWHGRVSDLFNQHRSAGGNKKRVHFHRHVHPETGEPFTSK